MLNRREFAALSSAAAVAAGLTNGTLLSSSSAQEALTAQTKVTVDLPRGRVPLSFIIDDSTCLVNMGKFCMPQFATALPDREDYKKPWRDWPSEIPDNFMRDFGSWCAEHDVRGKFKMEGA